MKRLYTHAKSLLAYEEPLVLAGDYNVILTPLDAKNPQEWNHDALFLPQTRQALQRILYLGFMTLFVMLQMLPHSASGIFKLVHGKK